MHDIFAYAFLICLFMRIATMTSNRIARTVIVYAYNHNPREISFILYTHTILPQEYNFLLQVGTERLMPLLSHSQVILVTLVMYCECLYAIDVLDLSYFVQLKRALRHNFIFGDNRCVGSY